jgi:hypothetical protein
VRQLKGQDPFAVDLSRTVEKETGMTFEFFRFFQFVGLMFIALGAILFLLPFLLDRLPALERVPWVILYVYRRNGFVFATSPLLIIISVISLVWGLITQART